MKKIFVLFAILFALTSCGTAVQNNTTESPQEDTAQTSQAEVEASKTQISSSILPISSVINAIGGEYVEVTNIVPAGVSPHGFDMSAKAMAKLEDSEIVFLTGLEHIDGFLEKAASDKKQIHLADGMILLEAAAHDHGEHEEDEHAEEDEHSDEHAEESHEETHTQDPHIWLGKENIVEIAGRVRDELTKILPEQTEYFATNTETFINDVEAAYGEFAQKVDGKTPKEFIVFHDAYNYLFASVDLDNNLKIPFSENVLHESGTAHMAELVDEIQLHNIKYIFREPQFSDTNLEKFKTQYNLTVGTLDPLGTDGSASGYITNLRNNLESLSNIYE